jgi:tRNA-guanine family transglycosylase
MEIASSKRVLETPSGPIPLPAYIPVTTFGQKYPLDGLIRPYLPRLAKAVMVSLHYAKQMEQRPRLPLLIDSGGFAALFEGSHVSEEGELGVLYVKKDGNDQEQEPLHPKSVLDFQELHADVAFTLDFPIPPNLDQDEAVKRHRLTITNALWAIKNRRRKEMRLYACLQAWDVESAKIAACAYAKAGFDGIAIGGLVPRAKDASYIESIVKSVREVMPELPLHVFGLGKPEMTDWLFRLGVDSVDSSSYVKMAADGRLWGESGFRLDNPSSTDRVHLALCNLATASKATLPLSASTWSFTTTAIQASKYQV